MQETSAQQRFTGIQKFAHWIATGFYSGKSPLMPGTVGTLVSAPLFFGLELAFPLSSSFLGELTTSLIVTGIGLWSTQLALQGNRYGNNSEDPQEIVIDEFAGYAVTLLGCAANFRGFLLAFFLFRLFDMTKPPPIRYFERLPGALGIVADDIVAGIIAAGLGFLVSSYLF